jgi:cytochrome o ubiquinol oxidase subunit 2
VAGRCHGAGRDRLIAVEVDRIGDAADVPELADDQPALRMDRVGDLAPAGDLYAMGGMQTQLNLLAEEPGTYAGQNQQYSGLGYAGMNFKAIATSRDEFEAWVQKVRQSPQTLDLPRYEQLERPSENDPVTLFSSVEPALFDAILVKHGMPMEMISKDMNSDPHRMHMHTNPSERN